LVQGGAGPHAPDRRAWLCRWDAGQLEQALRGNGWFATVGSDQLLYERDLNSRWAAAFRSAGIDPRLLTSDFGTA
jgi:putative transcriptional regulator